jgi:hypothetical protein
MVYCGTACLSNYIGGPIAQSSFCRKLVIMPTPFSRYLNEGVMNGLVGDSVSILLFSSKWVIK